MNRKLLLGLGISVLMMGCQPSPKENGGKNNVPEPTEKEEITEVKIPNIPAPEGGYLEVGYYKRLEGEVGGIPIVMHLVKGVYEPWNMGGLSGEEVNGFYYYEKYQEPIQLSHQATEDPDSLKLIEWSEGQPDIKWSGTLNSEGEYVGIWEDKSNAKSLNFKLMERYPEGSIPLDHYCTGIFKKLDKQKVDGPAATTAYGMLFPKDTKSLMASEIYKALLYEGGDSFVVNRTLHPLAIIKNKAVQDIAQHEADYEAEGGAYFGEMRTQSTTMQVVWNKGGRLGLASLNYRYAGGAHGNYGTSYLNFDLNAGGKKIQLADIFQPDYEKVVSKALVESARNYFKVPEGKPIVELYDEAELVPTENFLLTEKGISFNYVPYEVAPYAIGEITLFIPFEKIQSVLK